MDEWFWVKFDNGYEFEKLIQGLSHLNYNFYFNINKDGLIIRVLNETHTLFGELKFKPGSYFNCWCKKPVNFIVDYEQLMEGVQFNCSENSLSLEGDGNNLVITNYNSIRATTTIEIKQYVKFKDVPRLDNLPKYDFELSIPFYDLIYIYRHSWLNDFKLSVDSNYFKFKNIKCGSVTEFEYFHENKNCNVKHEEVYTSSFLDLAPQGVGLNPFVKLQFKEKSPLIMKFTDDNGLDLRYVISSKNENKDWEL